MDTENSPSPGSRIEQVRILLWVLVAIAIAGVAVMLSLPKAPNDRPALVEKSGGPGIGGPFTLVGGDGKPFSSQPLAGKPYAIYFGFTRCGDVCPLTLRGWSGCARQAGGEGTLRIVFVTIDPANDGPKEVGQYAGLFGAPIIGLTGSRRRSTRSRSSTGFSRSPCRTAMAGKEMEHTATVLLFDRGGAFVATINSQEPDSQRARQAETPDRLSGRISSRS